MVKDIILTHTLTSLNVQDVVFDMKVLRVAGLMLIWNTLGNEYDVLPLQGPLVDEHCVLCLDGTLTSVSDSNLERLLYQINEAIVKKEAFLKLPWSHPTKPRRNVK